MFHCLEATVALSGPLVVQVGGESSEIPVPCGRRFPSGEELSDAVT